MKQLLSPRDILLFETEYGDVWVSAVDSCGGIGTERNDSLQIDPVITGMAAARVALLEIMAAGAKPVFASLAISSGPHTAGPLMEGVRKILGDALPIVISTEKNMPTSMTGLGVTVTGLCKKENLRIAHAKAGDILYCAGRPLVGGETLEAGVTLFDSGHLKALLENKQVHTLLPVGSRGIAAEAEVLAKESSLKSKLSQNSAVDLYKSAGPSTCAVFSSDGRAEFKLDLPVFEIGVLLQS